MSLNRVDLLNCMLESRDEARAIQRKKDKDRG